MTVRDFVQAVQDKPELLDLTLGHAPWDGVVLPIEAHQIYKDWTDNGSRCLCVSGGGYPIRIALTHGAVVKQ